MAFEVNALAYTVTVVPKVESTLTVVSTRPLSLSIDTGTAQVTVKSIIVSASVSR